MKLSWDNFQKESGFAQIYVNPAFNFAHKTENR